MSEGLNKGTNERMNAYNCFNYLLASLINSDMYTRIYIYLYIDRYKKYIILPGPMT